jgi:hypothetical protein
MSAIQNFISRWLIHPEITKFTPKNEHSVWRSHENSTRELTFTTSHVTLHMVEMVLPDLNLTITVIVTSSMADNDEVAIMAHAAVGAS